MVVIHWSPDLFHIGQGSSNLAREIHFPAEFSTNPYQTHPSILINVFRIIRKSQVKLIRVGAKLCPNSDGNVGSLNEFLWVAVPCRPSTILTAKFKLPMKVK